MGKDFRSREAPGQNRNNRSKKVSGARRFPAGVLIFGGLLGAVVIAFVIVAALDARQQASSGPPAGVTNINVGPAGRHTTENVDYAQTPPAGGPHDPIWQNCGFYTQPVRNENAVHSLEHGAVWITYSPNLPADQKQKISEIAGSKTYILASPYKGLPSPVVVSAWGKQLRLDSANDPRLEQFIRTFRQGPQTPEPGAPCTGGTGTPS